MALLQTTLLFFVRLSHTHSFCFGTKQGQTGFLIKDGSISMWTRSDYVQQSNSCAPRPQSHVLFPPCWLCSKAGGTTEGDSRPPSGWARSAPWHACILFAAAYETRIARFPGFYCGRQAPEGRASPHRMHQPKITKNPTKHSSQKNYPPLPPTSAYYGLKFPTSASFDSTFFSGSFTQQCCLNHT